MNVQRIAAFSEGSSGGNPAGVVLCEALPDAASMQAVAREVGYSETAFAAPIEDGWRVRYFAPEIEVPFCGHATIALGAALALAHGSGVFPLQLNDSKITVQGTVENDQIAAALQSPPTRSEPAPEALLNDVLRLFSYTGEQLDRRLSPAIAEASARFLVVPLADRRDLSAMRYDFEAGRRFMLDNELVTINFIHAEEVNLFHARNAFAFGGVYEDPATGAAAAAFAGYLRDVDWPHEGSITILQGFDMGVPSRLRADISGPPGTSIRVSGGARVI